MRAALDVIGAPATGFRYVLVDARGRLWVRNGLSDDALPTEWVVYRPNGVALARVITPAGYEPHHVGDDFVLGRMRDTMNVEYIRLYALAAPAAAAADPVSPADRIAAAPPALAAPDTVADALLGRMRSVLGRLMVRQELFYARPENGYRCASRADQLEWPEDMSDLDVYILRGDARGWTALLFHRTQPIACGITTGAGGPIGWTPGVVVCE